MRRSVRSVRLKGLWIHPQSGLPYYRTRRGGKPVLVPLPVDLPHDHPDFIAAWAEVARSGKAPERARPAAGTLASTWAAALASDSFHGRSASYRGIIARHARQITDRAGTVKAAAIGAKHVRADLAQASDPNGRHRAWRFWGRYCVERGWLDNDPTQGVSIPARARPRGRHGHPAWSRDEIAAFRAAYPVGSTPRAIMELTYWTGARISDVVKIGRQHIDADGVLCFRQTKTEDMAYVPWSCGLPPTPLAWRPTATCAGRRSRTWPAA